MLLFHSVQNIGLSNHKLKSALWSQCMHVTDGQTDRRTLGWTNIMAMAWLLYRALKESLLTLVTVTVYCSAKQQISGGKSTLSNFVRVHSDGTCVWWPLLEQSESHCQIDVTWYPFDDQRCNFIFESWKYNSDVVRLIPKHRPEDFNYYSPSEEWNLLGKHQKRPYSAIFTPNDYQNNKRTGTW